MNSEGSVQKDPQPAALPESVPAKGGRNRILGVEIGRGLAALAVVLFHANITSRSLGLPNYPWMNALEHGVDFFFVLSGFIIYMAHANDIGGRGEVTPYIRKRAIRLFPLLWAVVLGYAALRLLLDKPTDPLTLLRSLIPYPSLEDAAPLVIWTLRHELLFYLLFALVIWRPRLGWPVIGLWVLASLAQMIVILAGGQGIRGVASMVVSSFTFDFIMGIALAAAYRSRPFVQRWFPLALALGVLTVILWLTGHYHLKRESFADYVSVVALLWVPVLGAAFAGILYGLLSVESYISPRNWLIRLGSASYAVYLVHTPVGGMMLLAIPYLPAAWLDWGAVLVLVTVPGVAAGFILHYYFEKPVAAWLRRHWVPVRTNRRNLEADCSVPVANAKRMADTMR